MPYLYWLARLLGIKLSLTRLVLVTLLVLLILNPFSVMTASFWLSFYAVTIIFLTLWRFKAWLTTGSSFLKLFKGLFLIQVMLTLMIIPITALFFQKISLVSLMANIIAVPWMSFISIPAALLSVIMTLINDNIAQLFMMVSLHSLEVLWQYLTLLNTSIYANVGVSQQTQFIMLLVGTVFFIGLFCVSLVSPFKLWLLTPYTGLRRVLNNLFVSIKTFWPIRFAVLPVCLVAVSMMIVFSSTLFLVKREYYWPTIVQQKAAIIGKDFFAANDSWQVVFFDVGQGLSILIRQSNKAILYDTGASFPSGFSMSEAVVLPYLQYAGIDYLDKVILSHSDNDHSGGLNTLLNHIQILEVMSNDSQVQQSLDYLKLTTKQQSCHSEGSFSWQDLNFTILWPLAQHKTSIDVNANQTANIETSKHRHKPGNDDSCVILITDKHGNSFLLSGDISTKIEKQLVLRYPNLRADVLQVPHHGSKTSSSLAFLTHLSPTLAIVSAGYLNRWRMPVAEVRQRYAANDISLINNADVGQIVVTFNKKGHSQESFTENFRPFWFTH
jgi:competence protein ComEC